MQNQSEARIRDLALARLAQRDANFELARIRFQRVREQSQVAGPDWI
ncbi:hypothetical protein [Ahniella affigens]|nr:hypothetical protein [Ahniella affigens]